MEISYYPGCTLTGSAQDLDESFRSVAAKLDILLKEIPDWTCCGASSAIWLTSISRRRCRPMI